jgi:hypothetical protein
MDYALKYTPEAESDLAASHLTIEQLNAVEENLKRLAQSPTSFSELAGHEYPPGQLFQFYIVCPDMRTRPVKVLFQYAPDELHLWLIRIWFGKGLTNL